MNLIKTYITEGGKYSNRRKTLEKYQTGESFFQKTMEGKQGE